MAERKCLKPITAELPDAGRTTSEVGVVVVHAVFVKPFLPTLPEPTHPCASPIGRGFGNPAAGQRLQRLRGIEPCQQGPMAPVMQVGSRPEPYDRISARSKSELIREALGRFSGAGEGNRTLV